MIDYIQSKLAKQEYEQRVRSLTPIQEFDSQLTDDRKLTIYPIRSGIVGTHPEQSDGIFRQIQRFLTTLVNGLSFFGKPTKHTQGVVCDGPSNQPRHEEVLAKSG